MASAFSAVSSRRTERGAAKVSTDEQGPALEEKEHSSHIGKGRFGVKCFHVWRMQRRCM